METCLGSSKILYKSRLNGTNGARQHRANGAVRAAPQAVASDLTISLATLEVDGWEEGDGQTRGWRATSRFSGFLLILLYYVTSGPKFITMV